MSERPEVYKTAYQAVLDDYWRDYSSMMSRQYGRNPLAQLAPKAPAERFDDGAKDGTTKQES